MLRAFSAAAILVQTAMEFVSSHRVQTVFGMGGSYFDGTLAVAIMFTDEKLERMVTDRFASFIGTFKIRTTKLHQNKLIY